MNGKYRFVFLSLLTITAILVVLKNLPRQSQSYNDYQSIITENGHPLNTENKEGSNPHENLFKKAFAREPPTGFANWVDFANSLNCDTQDFTVYSQIYRDLEPWLSLSEIPISTVEHMKTTPHIRQFVFVDGKLMEPKSIDPQVREMYINGGLAEKVLQGFNFSVFHNTWDEPMALPAEKEWPASPVAAAAESLRYNRCMNKTFGGTRLAQSHGQFLGPASWASTNLELPILSNCKVKCYADIVAPLNYHIGIALEGPVRDPFKWEDKLNVLFFRGTTTGFSTKGPGWRRTQRMRMVQWEKSFSKFYPNRTFTYNNERDLSQFNNSFPIRVDVGVTEVTQCLSPAACDEVKEFVSPLKPFVNFQQTMRFKYLLIVDGNSWASRLQKYLSTNSVILYNGIYTDWYNHMLIPFVHYVPVAPDFSDLEERLEWLEKNDDKAKQIAANAKKLADKYAQNVNQQKCYTGLLVLEYANRFPKNYQ